MSLFIYPPTPVSVVVPPTGILVDGIETPIDWNTTNPNLTIPMPSLSHYMENGALEVVNYDGTTKANTRAFPVKIVGADGSNVNIDITTGDISIQTTHTGSNPDSMQVGNGTTIWQVEAVTGKGLVKDQSAIDELILIKGLVDSSTNGQSTEAKQDDGITALGLISKEATQLLMSAKLPATLGSKADAASLAVTQSTEDKTVQADIKTAVEAVAAVAVAPLKVVDVLDAKLFDAVSTNIPASASPILVVVASLASDCKEIEIIDDIGEFIDISVNGTYHSTMPLGGGRIILNALSTESIELRASKNTVIALGNMAINFLG